MHEYLIDTDTLNRHNQISITKIRDLALKEQKNTLFR